MNKIFYKKLDPSGNPSGSLFYVRDEESADAFKVVYQTHRDKWIVLFDLKTPTRGKASKCQVFTKRGLVREFTLTGAYKLVDADSNESQFVAVFDRELSIKQIAFAEK